MAQDDTCRPHDSFLPPSLAQRAIDHLQVALLHLQRLQRHPPTPEHLPEDLATIVAQLDQIGELLHRIQVQEPSGSGTECA
jgi:hypothetical protein